MELQKLKYFLVAASTENFNRAAKLCAVAQPVLSRQIANLEQELGVALFIRHKKRVKLSPAGKRFAEYVKTVFEKLAEGQTILAEYKNGISGTVKLGCVEPLATNYLAKHLPQFAANYPKIQIEISVSGPDEIIEGVETEKYDLGLIALPLGEGKQLTLLSSTELYRDRVYLVTPKNHPVGQKQSVKLAELQDERVILLKEGFGVRRVVAESYRRAGVELAVWAELDLISGVKALVRSGAGVSFLVESSVVESDLNLVRVEEIREEFSFRLVTKSVGNTGEAARIFRASLILNSSQSA